MPRVDDRDAARRLAAVLDGAEPGDADLATVARVLRDAAAAARFDVADVEIEVALDRARPRAPQGRRRGRGSASPAWPRRRRRAGRR